MNMLKKNTFQLSTHHTPAGDQPEAIKALADGVRKGVQHQTLLGVTGSGKTFTAANVIAQIGKPTLVIAHNKTLAAQLTAEYREFFPNNAVHYFVSYYDYYQPEAYLPVSDTYIEKEAQINKEIDRLRHASTQALLTRKDVIIVASVSCIYALGSPEEYLKVHLEIAKGAKTDRSVLARELVRLYFERTNADLNEGQFRAVGNTIEVMPKNERIIYRVEFDGANVARVRIIDAITRADLGETQSVFIFPAKHYVTPENERGRAIADIQKELKDRLAYFERAGKILEAERIKRRTNHDLALIREVGYCNGIENYSRQFDGRAPGSPPFTLLDYFPHTKDGKPDFLTIIDESHVTVPQIGGMYAGDRARKETLIEHGFRLPSAFDNRPLQFDEFDKRIGQVIYTSATPAAYEREKSAGHIVKQIIRPTGLLDPIIEVRPVTGGGLPPLLTKERVVVRCVGQVEDVISEAQKVIKGGARVLLTTLTKKMAEDLSEFLKERNIKSAYIHSDVETLDRITTLTDFRKGKYDVLVGVNLLREGLDLPEVELVAILDADKSGFLRSETALIQTIGRAARNSAGRVILYADEMTPALEAAIKETRNRRAVQEEYNKKHNITPITIKKRINDITEELRSDHDKAVVEIAKTESDSYKKNPKKFITEKRKQMADAVRELDFETAALIRDEITALEGPSKKK